MGTGAMGAAADPLVCNVGWTKLFHGHGAALGPPCVPITDDRKDRPSENCGGQCAGSSSWEKNNGGNPTSTSQAADSQE